MSCPVKPRLHVRCETLTRKGRGGFKVWVTRKKYHYFYKSKNRRRSLRFASIGWIRFLANVRLADALKRALA